MGKVTTDDRGRIIVTRDDGCIEYHLEDEDGPFHREDGPAMYYPDRPKGKEREVWWLNGVCHREDGPAQIWWNDNGEDEDEGDGELARLWFIHGVKVTQEIVETPTKIPVEDILKIDNIEVRRIAIDRAPIERVMDEGEAKVIDMDTHVMNGHRALMEIGGALYLHVCCPSTGRTYFIEVPPKDLPPNIKTCEEADAWISGMEDAECRQVGRT